VDKTVLLYGMPNASSAFVFERKTRLLEALEVGHTNKLNTYDVFPAWQIRLIAASNVFIHEGRCQFFG
jgi:hypothetical protein